MKDSNKAPVPDRILYYEAYVEVDVTTPIKSVASLLQIGKDHGFKDGHFGSVLPFSSRSANKERLVEDLGEFIAALKGHCIIRMYRYGAVYVDSNNWDTLNILGNDPHADKR